MVTRKERLQIEIELMEWLLAKTETPNYREHFYYSFSLGVLQEKKSKLKEGDGK